jgi:hypothetical protein
MGIPINVLIQLMFSIDPAATSEYNQRTQHNSGATPHSQVPPRYLLKFLPDFALVLPPFRGWPRGGSGKDVYTETPRRSASRPPSGPDDGWGVWMTDGGFG